MCSLDVFNAAGSVAGRDLILGNNSFDMNMVYCNLLSDVSVLEPYRRPRNFDAANTSSVFVLGSPKTPCQYFEELTQH